MAIYKETALITGGAHGIGLACARKLSASGSNIILLDTDAEALAIAKEQFEGQTIDTVTADITDYTIIKEVIKRVDQECSPITQMVNSAGIAGPNANLEEYPTDDWQKIIDVNLTGSFHMLKAVLPGMKSRGYGRIVMVASVAGKDGNPNASAYSASKAGVIALIKSAGKECAKIDIGINCITPAAAKTRIFDQMNQEHIEYMLSKIPRERFLKVEEAADMVNWLCSRANSFSTGAVFDLSGGRATY